jgi:hypothetical protein
VTSIVDVDEPVVIVVDPPVFPVDELFPVLEFEFMIVVVFELLV